MAEKFIVYAGTTPTMINCLTSLEIGLMRLKALDINLLRYGRYRQTVAVDTRGK